MKATAAAFAVAAVLLVAFSSPSAAQTQMTALCNSTLPSSWGSIIGDCSAQLLGLLVAQTPLIGYTYRAQVVHPAPAACSSYGRAHCEAYVNELQCHRCLEFIVNNIHLVCGPVVVGGRFALPGCGLRFEDYPFSTNDSPPAGAGNGDPNAIIHLPPSN